MRSVLLLAFGAAVIVAIGAGFALANNGGNVYTGCLTNGGAINKVAIGEDPARPCEDDQEQISWSEEGPQGPPGADGQDGQDGTVAPVYTKTAENGGASLGEALANNKTATVSCNAGDQLVSGGVELRESAYGEPASMQDLADHLTILQSRPLGAATGWRAQAYETPENGLGSKGWRIVTWAVCQDLTP